MGKGTEKKLWCIKVSSNAAFLFKGGKKVPHFQDIVGAESVDGSSTSLSEMSSPIAAKELLKVSLGCKLVRAPVTRLRQT